MNLNEKVAYLRGLMEGLKVEDKSDEGKVLAGVLDILCDMAETIEFLEQDQEEMADKIEGIDEDLAELEVDFYESDDEYDEDEDEVDDDGLYEIECPKCKETICLDDSILLSDEDIHCPNCNELIEIEMDCDCDCGCKGEHHHE
ncbi:MAG: hypothetical protein H7Y41_01155 [Hyphomonadaceae bacterium]|nr:hypothetical protein [Clostridia bacterium]